MAYKPEKYNEFLSKGYDLYLKKMYKGKETIKEVEIKLIPIVGSLKDIEGLLPVYAESPEGPAVPYRRESITAPTSVKPRAPMAPSKVSRPVETTPKSVRKLTKVKANKFLWISNNIKSEVADNISYIKYNRRLSLSLSEWGQGKGLKKFLHGNGIDIKRTHALVNIRSFMNRITLIHGDLKVEYHLGDDFIEPVFGPLKAAGKLEDRLLSLIHI